MVPCKSTVAGVQPPPPQRWGGCTQAKVLLKRFYLNGHTIGSRWQKKKIRTMLHVSIIDCGSERVNVVQEVAREMKLKQNLAH